MCVCTTGLVNSVCVYIYVCIFACMYILSSKVKFYTGSVKSASSTCKCVVHCKTDFLIRRHTCGGSI